MIPGPYTMAALRSLKEDGQMCVCLYVLKYILYIFLLCLYTEKNIFHLENQDLCPV